MEPEPALQCEADAVARGARAVTAGVSHPVERLELSLRVAPSDAEYFDTAMRSSLLRRLAEETEGRFYKAGDTAKLVDAITYSGKGVTIVEEKELWDMPVILLALLALMGGEWAFRRSRGLA